MAITIKCPYCGGKTSTRSSDRPTPTTIEAEIYCPNCNNMRATFHGELSNIRRAQWIADPEAKQGVFEQNRLTLKEDDF